MYRMVQFSTVLFASTASLLAEPVAGTSGLALAQPTPVAAPASERPEQPGLTSMRSRQIELHYRLSPPGEDVHVELWYTRDRGSSWHCQGKDDDRTSPMVFSAPSEGLYGFMLIPCVGGQTVRPAPAAYEAPQRWVFIDSTPPLVQWNRVEPAENFRETRVLQLRWTAHDDNLAARPVSLAFQSSLDQNWQDIESAVANTGAYDWRLPEGIAGQVTIKLIVRDQGGHAVERNFGPVNLDAMIAKLPPGPSDEASASAGKATDTQPALASALNSAAATQPALPRVDLLERRMAADLHRQGNWHLVRGQYAQAAERLLEALEHDPDLLEARHDLAGIFYRQQNYDRALHEYNAVLGRNPQYESALYGAALAYVAKRDYHQSREMLTRLLKVNGKNQEAWLDLGDVLFMMGDVDNARANWRQAIKINPAAGEVSGKAQRRLELYGADELSSTRNPNQP